MQLIHPIAGQPCQQRCPQLTLPLHTGKVGFDRAVIIPLGHIMHRRIAGEHRRTRLIVLAVIGERFLHRERDAAHLIDQRRQTVGRDHQIVVYRQPELRIEYTGKILCRRADARLHLGATDGMLVALPLIRRHAAATGITPRVGERIAPHSTHRRRGKIRAFFDIHRYRYL